MIAEILAIGNEVVDGSVVNTNASWLAERLSAEGIRVDYHTAIPDSEALMLDVFARAAGRAELVVVTGGLGPTVDDFTIEVAAKFFGKPRVVHAPSLERLHRFFEKLGRTITPNQENQAKLPEGATVLENHRGTAPGAYYRHEGVHFAFLPGVPSEMKAMFEGALLPILLQDPKRGPRRVLKVLRCFGLPEGQLDHQLRREIQGRVGLWGVQLGFRIRFPSIDIRLSAENEDAVVAEEALARAAESLRERLGQFIYGEGETTLAQIVAGQFTAAGHRLATAESCTGGLLAHELTNVPGASVFFREGIVSYSNEAKIELLQVRSETLQNYGAVSGEVAVEMARGLRQRSRVDWSVAITGIAGPGGGTEAKPVGTVHLAILHPWGEWEQRFQFPFDRERFKQLATATALDKMRRIFLDNA